MEAAHAAEGWTAMTGHARAQVLFYLAENLFARKEEFGSRLSQQLGVSASEAAKEVNLSIERIYRYAALADKYDGNVHHTTLRNVTLAMPEALGVMGVVCPEHAPLLGFERPQFQRFIAQYLLPPLLQQRNAGVPVGLG